MPVIVHASGLQGAEAARGTVVVIDVLRAFTVSAVAFARGAAGCLLVSTLEQANVLAAHTPGALISAEVDGLPVEGVPISNSPSQLLGLDLTGRVLIQRTSAGTQGVWRARQADAVYAGSLVVAAATVAAIRRSAAELVTLVATGEPEGHLEDQVCGLYMEALLRGRPFDLEPALAPLWETERIRRVLAGKFPGFSPADLEIALRPDTVDFAMRALPEPGCFRLVTEPGATGAPG